MSKKYDDRFARIRDHFIDQARLARFLGLLDAAEDIISRLDVLPDLESAAARQAYNRLRVLVAEALVAEARAAEMLMDKLDDTQSRKRQR